LVATKCRQFQRHTVSRQFGRTVLRAVAVDSIPAQRQAVRSAVAADNPRCLVSGSAAGYRSTFTGFPATQLQIESLRFVSHSYGIFPLRSFLSYSAIYSCFQLQSRWHVSSFNEVITLGRSIVRENFRKKQ